MAIPRNVTQACYVYAGLRLVDGLLTSIALHQAFKKDITQMNK